MNTKAGIKEFCDTCVNDKLLVNCCGCDEYSNYEMAEEETIEDLEKYINKFDLINNVEVNMMFKDKQGDIWTVLDVYEKKCTPSMVLMSCEGKLLRIHCEDLLDMEVIC